MPCNDPQNQWLNKQHLFLTCGFVHRLCTAAVAQLNCWLQVEFRANAWRNSFPGHALVMARSRKVRIQPLKVSAWIPSTNISLTKQSHMAESNIKQLVGADIPSSVLGGIAKSHGKDCGYMTYRNSRGEKLRVRLQNQIAWVQIPAPHPWDCNPMEVTQTVSASASPSVKLTQQ